MQRFVVVGTSCSGKTTLARQMAEVLGVVHIELDAIYWNPEWCPTPSEEFRARVRAAVSPDRWIVEGNYHPVRDIVWSRATAVVWLNYSLPRVFGRAVRRTVVRSVCGEELFSGNRETFRRAFLSRESILLWVLTSYRRVRKEYRKLFDERAFGHLRLVELRQPREADGFLQSLAAPMRSS